MKIPYFRKEYPRGALVQTAQLTCYHIGDDGDLRPGLPQLFSVLDTGQFAGTTAIDVAHYANNGISFVAPSTINDAGAGLVTFLAADTIRVRGSAANDGVYTIAVGGVAGQIVVNEATIVNEGAGAYVTICKRSTPSNNCVIDNNSGKMWKRYNSGGPAEPIGITSNGALNWYDTLTCYTLHPAAADLQMMVTGIKIVGGAAELPRYYVGMIIDPSGFANAVNNLPGYRVTSIAVNGADLDILLWTGNQVLIAEAAAGARDIRVVCRSIHTYCEAANAVSFGGYTDWRIPNSSEIAILRNLEAATGYPDAVAFPGWVNATNWTSNTDPSDVTAALYIYWIPGTVPPVVKTNATICCELVRG